MTHVERGETITDAWLAALAYLNDAEGKEQFNLIVDIEDPTPDASNPAVVEVLDRLLASKGLQRTETVANTIFPAELARTSPDPERLFERYRRIAPRLQKQPKNRKGIYFERLIDFPLRPSLKDGRRMEEGDDPPPINQLATLIHDLRTEVGHRATGKGAKRHMFEAQIFAPGKDRRPMGFPCMSSLSFHIDRDRLRLSTTYRNQYYVERALGNFLGLGRLQRFMADAVGLRQGPLTVHAFHAEIEAKVSLAEAKALMGGCQAVIPLRIVWPRPA